MEQSIRSVLVKQTLVQQQQFNSLQVPHTQSGLSISVRTLINTEPLVVTLAVATVCLTLTLTLNRP